MFRGGKDLKSMAIQDVANGLVGLCKSGQFDEAMTRYYSNDIVSIEPHGEQPEARGIAAVKAKAEWWSDNFEVTETNVSGPFINGDQFSVLFNIDATEKSTGKRMPMEEIAVYTVKDDKIVNERFFNQAKS
jgi:ketosteroid isomerase-like protein